MIQIIGTKLIMMESLFLFTRKIQAKIELIMTATGYKVITKTKEVLYKPIPASKLMKDKPQITNHGNKERLYRIWAIIKNNFTCFPLDSEQLTLLFMGIIIYNARTLQGKSIFNKESILPGKFFVK